LFANNECPLCDLPKLLNKSEHWRATWKGARFQWVPTLVYRILPEAKKDFGGYLMDYYNRQRPHTFNDGSPPVAVEERLEILSEIS
jgi:putative transposase